MWQRCETTASEKSSLNKTGVKPSGTEFLALLKFELTPPKPTKQARQKTGPAFFRGCSFSADSFSCQKTPSQAGYLARRKASRVYTDIQQ